MDIGLSACGVNKSGSFINPSFKANALLVSLICRFPSLRPMRFCHICFCLVRLWGGCRGKYRIFFFGVRRKQSFFVKTLAEWENVCTRVRLLIYTYGTSVEHQFVLVEKSCKTGVAVLEKSCKNSHYSSTLPSKKSKTLTIQMPSSSR